MCGIAGVFDLQGNREVPNGVVEKMTEALFHRGPDEDGYYQTKGIAMGMRRLSIVGLKDGQQPVSNENQTAHVVFNGELFDHVEQRDELKKRGHVLAKSCDTEIIPHLWEDHGRDVFEKLRGQFAVALWDQENETLLLGRDRFGIAPL